MASKEKLESDIVSLKELIKRVESSIERSENNPDEFWRQFTGTFKKAKKMYEDKLENAEKELKKLNPPKKEKSASAKNRKGKKVKRLIVLKK